MQRLLLTRMQLAFGLCLLIFASKVVPSIADDPPEGSGEGSGEEPAAAAGGDRATSVEVLAEQKEKPVNDPNCRNVATNCLENIRLCDHKVYHHAMKKNCQQTCGVCVNPAVFECKDHYTPDCQAWGRAFCESRIYSKAMKLTQCASFCGLC